VRRLPRDVHAAAQGREHVQEQVPLTKSGDAPLNVFLNVLRVSMDRPLHHCGGARLATLPKTIRLTASRNQRLARPFAENALKGVLPMTQASCKEAIEAAISCLETALAVADEGPELEAKLATLRMIYEQRGCEHFDPAVKDGRLTTLMDVVIFG
jgi:hypothetical protein